MTNIIIRIPKKSFDRIREEYKDAEDRKLFLNFKTRNLPNRCEYPNKVFFAWDGYVRGYHILHDLLDEMEGFTCETTDKYWGDGNYIQRRGETIVWLGKLYKISMRGQWSWRYVKPDEEFLNKL